MGVEYQSRDVAAALLLGTLSQVSVSEDDAMFETIEHFRQRRRLPSIRIARVETDFFASHRHRHLLQSLSSLSQEFFSKKTEDEKVVVRR